MALHPVSLGHTKPDKPHLYLTQMPRIPEKSSVSFACIDSEIWKIVGQVIIEGGHVDRFTNSLNGKFLGILTDKHEQIMSLISRVVRVPDCREPTEAYSKQRLALAMSDIEEQNLPFFAPIRLLHYDAATDAVHAEEFDIHERIIFQMFHAWGGISAEHRRQLIQYTSEKCEKKNMVEVLVAMARHQREDLFLLLMKIRAKHLRKPRTQKPGPCAGSTQCTCVSRYYLTRLYEKFYDDEASKDQTTALAEHMDCQTFAITLVAALLILWEAIQTIPVGPVLKINPDNFRVHFKLAPDDPALFNNDKGVVKRQPSTTLECTHKGLSTMIARHYCFHTNYSTKARVTTSPTGEPCYEIFAWFDDNVLILIPTGDVVLNSRLDKLHDVLRLAEKSGSRGLKRLGALLNNSFPNVQAMATVAEKMRWIGLEFVFLRSVNLYPAIAGEYRPTTDDDLLELTFGIATESDTTWAENDRLVVMFLNELAQMHEKLRAETLQQFIDEEDRAKEKAKKATQRKAGTRRPHTPPPVEPVEATRSHTPPPPEKSEDKAVVSATATITPAETVFDAKEAASATPILTSAPPQLILAKSDAKDMIPPKTTMTLAERVARDKKAPSAKPTSVPPLQPKPMPVKSTGKVITPLNPTTPPVSTALQYKRPPSDNPLSLFFPPLLPLQPQPIPAKSDDKYIPPFKTTKIRTEIEMEEMLLEAMLLRESTDLHLLESY